MFGNSNKRSRPQSTIDSLIGVGTLVEGNISFTGGLRIDGQVRGHVYASGDMGNSTLVIGEQAQVTGHIQAAHAVIDGLVEGPLHVQEFLEIQSHARVLGDVHYKNLEIHLGAVIEGRLTRHSMDGEAKHPNLKLGYKTGAEQSQVIITPLPKEE